MKLVIVAALAAVWVILGGLVGTAELILWFIRQFQKGGIR